MDWITQYCWDDNFPQIDVQIQHNPSQIPEDTLIEIDELILMFMWKSIWTRVNQNNFRKE